MLLSSSLGNSSLFFNMSVVIFTFSCCFSLILPVSLYITSISVGTLGVLACQSPLQFAILIWALLFLYALVCSHFFVLLCFFLLHAFMSRNRHL